MWSNRWSTMPVPPLPNLRLPDPDHRAFLDYMPGSKIPVMRQPFAEGDLLPYWSLNAPINDHQLYDIDNDPEENHNLSGEAIETQMLDMIITALTELEAPREQFKRLGL
jgi:hypothetical protein